MTDSENSFARHAGAVSFPRSAADLTDLSRCPACFSPLQSAVCGACGLDLRHPAATNLAEISRDVAVLLEGRVELIGRMRFDAATAAAAAATVMAATESAPTPEVAPTLPLATPSTVLPAPAVAPPGPVLAPSPLRPDEASAAGASPTIPSSSFPSGPQYPATPIPAPAAPTAPRRSSVQLVLLVVGVSLLSIAAIFFLIYAFITFGLLVRTLIIGAITVAAIVGATLLRRRGLRGTAEAIAVFAVVLIYLDAFALRANNLLGLGAADGQLYWGITLLLSAVGFLLWQRASGLGTPGIVAAAALPLGAGLATSGLLWEASGPSFDGGLRLFLSLLAVVLVGLVHSLLGRGQSAGSSPRPLIVAQRMILLGAALLCTVGAALAGLLMLPEIAWAPSGAYVVLAGAVALHLLPLATPDGRIPGAPVLRTIIAIAAGGLLAAALAASAPRAEDSFPPLIFALLWATIVALVIEFIQRPMSAGSRGTAVAATWSAAAVAAMLALAPLGAATWLAFRTALQPPILDPLRLDLLNTVVDPSPDTGLALLGLGGALLLVAAAWALGGRLRARLTIIAWGTVAVAILTAPLFTSLVGVAAYWFALGIGGLLVLLLVARRAPYRLRLPIGIGAAVATAGGYSLSWAGAVTWWIASLLVIGMLLLARRVFSAAIPRAALLGIASGAALAGAAVLGDRLSPASFGVSPALAPAELLCAAAIALLAAAAFSWGTVLSRVDRGTLFWIALPSATISAAISWTTRTLPTDAPLPSAFPLGITLALGLGLLLALVLWSALPSTTGFRIERIAAALAIAPATAWTLDSFARVLGLRHTLGEVVPASAALLVAAGTLAVSLRGAGGIPRWVRDVGVAIVAVPTVISAVSTGHALTWLVLFLSAVTTLLLSVSTDGLIAARGERKHLGWLALALGTAGLWLLLWDTEVTRLEAYVLPLAAALLGIAARARWASHRAGSPSTAAPVIALAGGLVAVVPLAGQSISDALPVAIIMTAVSAALLLLGCWFVGAPTWRPYVAAAAVTGALGVLVATVGRASTLVNPSLRGEQQFAIDLWLLCGAILLFCGALGQARALRRDDTPARRAGVLVLLLLATTPLLLVELLVFDAQPLGPLRAVAVVVLFSALHVVATVSGRLPFREPLRWIMFSYAAMATLAGLVFGVLDPIELGTVPLAVALLTTGMIHLMRTPAARSWPSLGPGLALLLLSSLLATTVDRPLWRLVALGVVGVAVIVWGVTRKLQAPFVLGSVVVLIHAIATFSPQIRLVYELTEWWLWAAIGGALLLFLGATYEKRIRDLRTTVLRIGHLR